MWGETLPLRATFALKSPAWAEKLTENSTIKHRLSLERIAAMAPRLRFARRLTRALHSLSFLLLAACNHEPDPKNHAHPTTAADAPVAVSSAGALDRPARPLASTSASPASTSSVPPPAKLLHAQGQLPSAQHHTQPLRLASWNLEWLHRADGKGPVKRRAADYQKLSQYAVELDADVIAVQEVDGVPGAERVFSPEIYNFFIADHAGPQDTGFVVRKELAVVLKPEVSALDVGGVRPGVDLALHIAGRTVRLLGLHLKSGCFSQALDRGPACHKLGAQVPVLEAWIDARQKEGVPFAVLGDFNRAFFASKTDEVWMDLNDGAPSGLTLWSPTSLQVSQCWQGKHPAFVDHLLLSAPLRRLASTERFFELVYADHDAKLELSDHCPIAIDLDGLPVPARPRTQAAPRPHDAARSSMAAPAHNAAAQASSTSQSGAADAFPATTLIKGNLSRSGRKLYHLPGCPDYEVTKIDEAHGERLFRSEAEAQKAGWIKAGNCR